MPSTQGTACSSRYHDDTNTTFFFTNSTYRIKGVLVATGNQTAAWDIPEATGWPSLHGPVDPATGSPQTPTSVTFCYDHELFLNPNAVGSYSQQWTWSINKTGFEGNSTLAAGQTYAAHDQVTVVPTGPTAGGPRVSGSVFLLNPTPISVTVFELSVLVGELGATVTCPGPLPTLLAPFSSLTCEFEVAVPDTSDRVVFTDADVDPGLTVRRSIETVSFSNPTTGTTEFDECVKVVDDKVASGSRFLGMACASGGTKTFTYSVTIGPFAACGPFSVVNTATFTGLETGATGSSSWTVQGQVPCQLGCTLTQRYWKTHSERGPAPYDDTWASVGGASTPFFLSGVSYYDALHARVGGNVYWTLARVYIAAQLNQSNGASFTAAQSAFDAATALLGTSTPSQVATDKSVRDDVVKLAAELDAYNNGFLIPSHCSQ